MSTDQLDDVSDFIAATELAQQDLQRMLHQEREANKRDHDAWATERAKLLKGLDDAKKLMAKIPTSGRRVSDKRGIDLLERFETAIERVLQDSLKMPTESSHAVDLDVTDAEAVPGFMDNCHAKGGGCDGHAGECREVCREWSFRFSAALVTLWTVKGRRYARFDITLEDRS